MIVEKAHRLDEGWVVQQEMSGVWFYTPDMPPSDYPDAKTKDGFGRTSRNFPTKEEAVAFGIGWEKDVEREL